MVLLYDQCTKRYYIELNNVRVYTKNPQQTKTLLFLALYVNYLINLDLQQGPEVL